MNKLWKLMETVATLHGSAAAAGTVGNMFSNAIGANQHAVPESEVANDLAAFQGMTLQLDEESLTALTEFMSSPFGDPMVGDTLTSASVARQQRLLGAFLGRGGMPLVAKVVELLRGSARGDYTRVFEYLRMIGAPEVRPSQLSRAGEEIIDKATDAPVALTDFVNNTIEARRRQVAEERARMPRWKRWLIERI